MEELVAEPGAAFLSADLGIATEVMPEPASYLDAWLRVLKADTRAIFTAPRARRVGPSSTCTVCSRLTRPLPAPAPTIDPNGDFLDMFAAMHDEDFGLARELALRLRMLARNGGAYPKFNSREEVETYVASVLRRTESVAVGTA